MSEKAYVLAELEQGPSTATEIALDGKITAKNASAHLSVLYKMGIVTRKKIKAQTMGKHPFLYELKKSV